MAIRYITPRDIGYLEALDRKCFSDAVRYNRYTLDHYLSLQNSFGLLETTEDNNTLMGFIIANEISNEIMNIVTIDVDPSFRRRGIGSKLINTAKLILKQRDVKKITLQVSMDNLPAIKFYEKHGFHITQRLPNYYPASDGYQMEYMMG